MHIITVVHAYLETIQVCIGLLTCTVLHSVQALSFNINLLGQCLQISGIELGQSAIIQNQIH